MKRLLLITILFFTVSVSAQKVEVSQEFVDDAAKAFALVVAQRDELAKSEQEKADLRKLVAELEKSSRTPCTIAMNQVKSDLALWLVQLDTPNKVKQKEILKILKDVRKTGKKIIAKQCGDDSKSVWAQVWDAAKVIIPVGAVLIAK